MPSGRISSRSKTTKLSSLRRIGINSHMARAGTSLGLRRLHCSCAVPEGLWSLPVRWQAGIGREWTVRLRTGYRGDGGLGGELAEARLVAPERHVKAHWPASAEMRAVARRLKRPVLGARPGGIPDLTPRGGGRRVRQGTPVHEAVRAGWVARASLRARSAAAERGGPVDWGTRRKAPRAGVGWSGAGPEALLGAHRPGGPAARRRRPPPAAGRRPGMTSVSRVRSFGISVPRGHRRFVV